MGNVKKSKKRNIRGFNSLKQSKLNLMHAFQYIISTFSF